jgi:hypothetical protein
MGFALCVNLLKSIYFNVWYYARSDLFCLNLKTVGLCSTLAGNKSERDSL